MPSATQVCAGFTQKESIHPSFQPNKKTGTATASGHLLVMGTAPTFMRKKYPCRIFRGRFKDPPESFGATISLRLLVYPQKYYPMEMIILQISLVYIIYIHMLQIICYNWGF